MVFCVFILVILAIFLSRIIPEIRSNLLFRKMLIAWTGLIAGLLVFLVILAFRFDGDWRSSSSITVSDYSSELIY
ncbi:hypothetical protein KC711_06035 [Candidatus Peregrinibacteria bacterium]|nr:hypothetical protein [Candidatus Peregrinibacteria bacterium]MCB9804107.1 hypothetical protein [Candidatus Peribacteria bacterium]